MLGYYVAGYTCYDFHTIHVNLIEIRALSTKQCTYVPTLRSLDNVTGNNGNRDSRTAADNVKLIYISGLDRKL